MSGTKTKTDWQRSEDGVTWEMIPGEMVEALLGGTYRDVNRVMVYMIDNPGREVRTEFAVYRYMPAN